MNSPPAPRGDSARSLFGTVLFRSYRADAERFGAIAEEYKRAGSYAGELIVFLGRQKDDVVFFKDPLVTVDCFDRALAVDYQERLRRLVKVHRSAITRLEVEHPRAKILGAEQMYVSDLVLARLVDLLLQADELHRISPFAQDCSAKLFQLRHDCQFYPIDNAVQACFS
jgi:hypothetical protein